MPKNVLLDFAGTVFDAPIDWERENRAGAEHLAAWLQDHSYKVPDSEGFVVRLLAAGRQLRHRAKEQRVEYVLGDLIVAELATDDIHLPPKTLSDAVLAYLEPELRRTVPFPGAAHALGQLHDDGYVLSLLSNAPSSLLIETALSASDLRELFTHILVSATVGYRKPHPQFIAAVQDTISFDPASTVLVGDRLYDDMVTAQALGIPGILFSARHHTDNAFYESRITPFRVVATWEDLYTLITQVL